MSVQISNVRTDKMLSQVLLAYTNADFVADRIFPMIGGLKDDTGDIPLLGNSHLRRYTSKRALYDEGQHRMQFSLSHDSKYSIDYYDLETYVPDRLANQQEAPFNLKSIAAMSTLEALKLEREIAAAESLTSTSVLTNNTTLSGTSQLNDYANSDPASVVETGRTTIQNAIGREANRIFMSRKVFVTLKNHPYFVERFKGISAVSAAQLIEAIKDLWEVEDVIIGKGIYVNSKEGQTETKTKVWNNDIVLFYAPSAPSLMTPSFGYHLETSSKPLQGTSRREPNSEKGDLVGAAWAYQDIIMDANAAYLIKDAVA